MVGLLRDQGLGGQDQPGHRRGVAHRAVAHLDRVDDAGGDEVDETAAACIEADTGQGLERLAHHDFGVEPTVGGDVVRRLVQCALQQFDALLHMPLGARDQVVELAGDAQQRQPAARHHAFGDGGARRVDRVFDQVQPALLLDRRGPAGEQDRGASRELGQPLFDLVALDILRCEFVLTRHLHAARGDQRRVAIAGCHHRLVRRDANLARATQIAHLHRGDAAAQVARDHPPAGEDREVFERGLAPVPVLWRMDRRHRRAALVAPGQQAHDAGRRDLFGDDQQRPLRVSHQRDDRGHLVLRHQTHVGHQDVRVVEHHLHLLDVGDHVVREVATVERHALDDFEQGLDSGAVLDVDDAIGADPLQGLGHELPGRVVVGSDHRDRAQFIAAAQWLGVALERCDDFGHRQLQPLDQLDRIRTLGQARQAVLYQRVGQHGRGGGAVAGDQVGLLRNLAQHLRAHVLERILEFDFGGDAGTVARDDRRTDRAVDDGVHPAWAKGAAHGAGHLGDAAAEGLAGLVVMQHDVGHGIRLLVLAVGECDSHATAPNP